MECKSMLFVKNHILIFETFQNLFSRASFLTAVKLFHEVILKVRSIKFRPLRIHNGG